MCKHARTARTARVALATVLAVALGAAAAPGASAGEYHVYSCRMPDGQPAPTDGWSEVAHSVHDVTTNTCFEGGALIAGLQDGYVHLGDSATDKATWAFEVPLHETISAGTLWRAGSTAGGSNTKASYLFWLSSTASTGRAANTFDECAAGTGCAGQGNASNPLADENRVVLPSSALESPYLSLNTYCGATLVNEAPCPEGKNDPGGYAATIELFAADLILSDTEPPSVSAVSGSLAEAPTVSGRSDLAFQASDSGSGVYEVVFKVDGQTVSTIVPEEEGGRCHNVGGTSDGLPAFLYTQPCPAAVSVDLPFDTTSLSNGAHHLLVNVLDAAGNATPVVDRQITVANPTAQSPGGESGETGAGANGSGNDSGSSAGAGAAGTGGPAAAPSAGGSTLVAGPANGTNASAEATLTAAWRGRSGERLAGAYGVAHTVEGRLVAPGGVPIGGAEIAVDELPGYAGARDRALPAARTGANGRWRLTLPRELASGQLQFSYRSHLGESLPVATRTLTLNVRAGVELGIAPRVARSGGSIRFAGRLLGGPIPAGGKQLVLEARSPGGRWLEFHVVRARPGSGRFRFVYRFHLPGPASYQFRVLCEAEADYPFAAGSSNVVGVYEG